MRTLRRYCGGSAHWLQHTHTGDVSWIALLLQYGDWMHGPEHPRLLCWPHFALNVTPMLRVGTAMISGGHVVRKHGRDMATEPVRPRGSMCTAVNYTRLAGYVGS